MEQIQHINISEPTFYCLDCNKPVKTSKKNKDISNLKNCPTCGKLCCKYYPDEEYLIHLPAQGSC
jgi:Zn finger protein HypA/HybF involved in hydrogenase expression